MSEKETNRRPEASTEDKMQELFRLMDEKAAQGTLVETEEDINYFLQNVQIFVLLFNFFKIFFELICGFDYIFHLSKSSNNSSALL